MIIDKTGNRLWLENNNVYLKLASELRSRNIAKYDPANRVIFVKRNENKHYHYKSKGYGFNYAMLERLYVDTIFMQIGKHKYKIPIEVFNANARVMNFSQQGFEIQKFLPLEIIRNYEV